MNGLLVQVIDILHRKPHLRRPDVELSNALFTTRQQRNTTESQTHSKRTRHSLRHRPYAQLLACLPKSQNHPW